jgi:MYXO-CTERM domain-containing protein
MSRAWVVTLLVLAGVSTASADEEHVQVERIVLSLDGAPVAVSAGDVITIEGTLSSTYDGSELDAFSRRTDGLDFVDAGPFIDVPQGSELIDADAASHRYVVRIGQDGVVAFAVQRLAMSQLVTRSEAASRLRGALELARPVTVVVPIAAAGASVLSDSVPASTPWWPFALLALGAAAAIPLSRRRSPFAPLLRRARRAQKAVAHEAARLGPAFNPVIDSARSLAHSVASLRDHVEETKAAQARIRGDGSEAAAKRSGLEEEAAGSLVRAAQLVDRLEGIAANMAAAVADHARATGVDDALALAAADLDLALDADAIARAM